MNTPYEKDKKYTANDCIVDMMAAVNADKIHLFYEYGERYQKTLSMNGSFYQKIGGLLRNRPMKMWELNSLPPEMRRLLTDVPVGEDDHCFMEDSVRSELELWAKEWEHRHAFASHRIPVRNKILLHGTTGNGKTTLAKNIAKMVKLPFVQISSAMMVDSHLGVTGRNIANVFSAISEPCIVFWDEIDSVATMRGSNDRSAANSEKNHNVNTLLIHLEKMVHNIIFVAATNRIDMLDPAFIRRFGLKLEIPSPTEENKEKFYRSLLSYHNMENNPGIESPKDFMEFESYNDIQLHVMVMMRNYILKSIPVTQEEVAS